MNFLFIECFQMIQQPGDMSQYNSMIPQLAAHMSALQIGTTGSVSIQYR